MKNQELMLNFKKGIDVSVLLTYDESAIVQVENAKMLFRDADLDSLCIKGDNDIYIIPFSSIEYIRILEHEDNWKE